MRKRGKEKGEGGRGERVWTGMMEGRQWWVLTLTINVNCCPSFRCHLVVFERGRPLSYMGGRLGAWALVFIRRGSFSYVGGGFRAWATVFVHRRPFSCVSGHFRVWAVISVCGWAASSVGGHWWWWDRCCAWGRVL